MALLIAVLATIGMLGAGMALFAYSRTRGRASRLRHLTEASGGERRALPPASLSSGLSDILERSRALRLELDTIALYGEQFAGLDATVERAQARPPRRPLWRRLEGASFDYATARAADGIRRWLAVHDALERADREVLGTLQLDDVAVRALLDRDLEREDQDPAHFAAELSRARDVLRRYEQELVTYSPHAYR